MISRSVNTLFLQLAMLLILLSSLTHAHAFTHPGIPLTIEDLNAVKAHVEAGDQPWKSGYDALVADRHSQLGYTMQGPFEHISRNPHVNRNQWMHDMQAVFNLARMWYFTGNEAYAQKSRDIIIAWATTQKSFTGMESNLDLGDFAYRFAGGADILRGTWSGWTQADTDTVKTLFDEVYWPATGAAGYALGPANKGTLSMAAAMAIAVFNDDQDKMDHVLYLLRTSAASGFLNTLPTGEVGESGRDQGHSYGQWLSMAFVAEVAWKQGIDLYSELDNRLLAAGEYHARNNLGIPTPFVNIGTTDWYYLKNASVGWPHGRMGMNLLLGAYTVRDELAAPYIQMKQQAQPLDADSFMFEKSVDTSTATPLPPIAFPDAPTLTTGMTDMEIGDASPVGESAYHDGKWILKGGGREIWTHGDDSAYFTYKKIIGDAVIIAKLDSLQAAHPNAKAGVMIRQSLDATSTKAWIAITPSKKFEFFMSGWTEVRGGSNWEKKSFDIFEDSYWLKIMRLGDVISLFISPDGTSWACVGAGRFENISDTTYLGMTVCSLNNGTLNTATFSNVRITGGDDGAPPTVPQAPLAVCASPGSEQVPLRWLESAGASSYCVKRATDIEGPYATIATVAGTSFIDTTVTNGQTYHYVISALNAAGESVDSPADKVTPIKAMHQVVLNGTPWASVAASGYEGADKAFDRSSSTKWFTGNRDTGWLAYDLGAGLTETVKRYAIISANDVPERDPKDWQFQGSTDGQNWTTLDTQSNQSFIYRHHTNTYDIDVPGDYRYYCLLITANNGAPGIQLSEWSLWVEDDGEF